MMRIAVVTIGYNLPGCTTRVIESALAGCEHEVSFLVISHSQMAEKIVELEQLAKHEQVTYRDYGENRGLAKSWNEGIDWGYHELPHDVVIIVNEDCEFGQGDLGRLAEAAVNNREQYIVTGNTFHQDSGRWDSSEYGCFAINPVALDRLGAFDENFFPIYCEDSDYRYRARLAGLAAGYCETTSLRHGGSESLKEHRVALQNGRTYVRNRKYLTEKWGGNAGSKQFTHPFNDRRFSYFIDPRLRDAPYPGFNRTDQAVVQY